MRHVVEYESEVLRIRFYQFISKYIFIILYFSMGCKWECPFSYSSVVYNDAVCNQSDLRLIWNLDFRLKRQNDFFYLYLAYYWEYFLNIYVILTQL